MSAARPTIPSLLFCAVAAAGCSSASNRPQAAIVDDEIRVLLPATLAETYDAIWSGLEAEGWGPQERRRDAFFVAITGEDVTGRRIHARMKRHSEDRTLLGVRITSAAPDSAQPAASERELRRLLPALLTDLEAYEPVDSEDDPFDYIHPDRFQSRFRSRYD